MKVAGVYQILFMFTSESLFIIYPVCAQRSCVITVHKMISDRFVIFEVQYHTYAVGGRLASAILVNIQQAVSFLIKDIL